MKRIPILLLIIIAATFVSIVGYIAYLDRELTKNFTGKLGSEIRVCGSEYSENSKEYMNVQNWLEFNKQGWQNYIVTAPVGTVITGEKISLIVAKNWVVATSYNDGVYSISAPTILLEFKCKWQDS